VSATPPLLHVIGAGPWQLGTIRRAKAMGLRVLATDGLADRPGYAEADRHEVADITDAEATLAVARRHRIGGVICDSTDFGVLTAACVAQALGLPGPGVEAARCCTDKALMTEAAARAGLAVPRSRRARDRAEALHAAREVGTPLVVKPVGNQSGRGVSIVAEADPAALEAAVDNALAHTRGGELLVQQCVPGREIIVDSLVHERRPQVLGIAVKAPYGDNPTVSTRITYEPAELPAARAAIERCNAALIAAVGLRQGLTHAEYIVTDDAVLPIDLAARGGGVMIHPLVLSHLAGADIGRAVIGLALGQAPQLPPAPRRAANIEFLRAPPGRIATIEGADAARACSGVAAVHLNLRPGDTVGGLEHKDQRLGFVVTLADTAADAVAQGERAAALIRTTVH
jgi:biotin carboxylase